MWSDDASPVQSVVDYLVALGHRRIARVVGLPGLEHTRLRTEAFLKAAHDHNLTEIDVVATDFSWEEGTAGDTFTADPTESANGHHVRQRRHGGGGCWRRA